MGKSLPRGSMFVDRRVILQMLTAMFIAQLRTADVLRDDVYVAGYRAGYVDALLALAAATGVAEEFASATRTAEKVAMQKVFLNGGGE